MHPHRLLSVACLVAVVCGVAVIGHPAPVAGVTPVQMCTAQNVAGLRSPRRPLGLDETLEDQGLDTSKVETRRRPRHP